MKSRNASMQLSDATIWDETETRFWSSEPRISRGWLRSPQANTLRITVSQHTKNHLQNPNELFQMHYKWWPSAGAFLHSPPDRLREETFENSGCWEALRRWAFTVVLCCFCGCSCAFPLRPLTGPRMTKDRPGNIIFILVWRISKLWRFWMEDLEDLRWFDLVFRFRLFP